MTSEPTSFSFTPSQAGENNNNPTHGEEEVQAIKKLQIQAKQLEIRACIYFLCFFLIVLSAYIPFMAFQKAMRLGIEQGLAYLTPLLLGITLTMGMVVAVLALVQLMGAQAIQKLPPHQVSTTDTPQSNELSSRIKKLQFISKLTLITALLAVLMNGVLIILG